jgi:amidase
MTSDPHYLELVEIARRIHAKEFSSVEATKAQLDRIGTVDKKLLSYALLTPEAALSQARDADAEINKGRIKGPLHGVPIAVKDLCFTKGVVTTGGMKIFKDFKPAHDATVVRRLRDAGAVILGKLQTTEGAYADHHPEIKAPLNPWNAAHWVGASSSGSAVATAAGLCYGSLGTDTGGSIRFPSAATGLTGLKPTWGRVSRHAVFELAATLDHIGPMTRSASDCAAMLGAIAGPDEHDPTALQDAVPNYLAGIKRGLRGLRIGIDPSYNTKGVDEATTMAVDAAIKSVTELGGDMRGVRFPEPADMVNDWFPLCGAEVAVAHEKTYPSRKSEYGPSLAGLIDIGLKVSGLDYQKIVLRRIAFRGRVAALFETIDLLMIPVQSFASPTVEEMNSLGGNADLVAALLRFTCAFNMTGSPTITLPCGFTAAGTPIAFQFVSAHLDEALLCRAGYAFQQATDWHRQHPKV